MQILSIIFGRAAREVAVFGVLKRESQEEVTGQAVMVDGKRDV